MTCSLELQITVTPYQLHNLAHHQWPIRLQLGVQDRLSRAAKRNPVPEMLALWRCEEAAAQA